MSWAKFDDQFPDHPKVKSVGAIGLAIQVAAICYSARYLTDGVLTYSVADALIRSLLSPVTDPDGRIWTIDVSSGMSGEEASALNWPAKMVESGLWEEGAGGFIIHDYLEYNPTGTQVKTERLAAKTRMNARRHGEKSNNNQGSSPEVLPKFSRSSSSPSPSPSPSLKEKKEPMSDSSKSDVMLDFLHPQSKLATARELLAHLNTCTGSKYRPVPANLDLIMERLKTATVEEITSVIDAKVAEWKSDPKNCKYLRPETLFRASKFEQYLGQLGVRVAAPPEEPGEFDHLPKIRNEDYWICGCPKASVDVCRSQHHGMTLAESYAYNEAQRIGA